MKKHPIKKVRKNDGRQKALNFMVNTLHDYAQKHGLEFPVLPENPDTLQWLKRNGFPSLAKLLTHVHRRAQQEGK